MKVTFNIRDYILDATDSDNMLTATTSFSVDELFDGNAIEEEHDFDIDLDDILYEQRQVAVIWTTDHVREIRSDLSEDQSWEVLKTCRARWGSCQGIDWQVIEKTAEEMFALQPVKRWHGRIDVTIADADGYGQGEVIHRLREMADLLAKDMPGVRANADEGSVRLVAEERSCPLATKSRQHAANWSSPTTPTTIPTPTSSIFSPTPCTGATSRDTASKMPSA
jgi:hypothetical protein